MTSLGFFKTVRTSVLASAVFLAVAPLSSAATVSGGSTSVTLDSATVTALTGLGFSIAPVSPATWAGLTATFPITGGDTTTAIDHSGGLAFTKAGATASIEDFVINLSGPEADKITGMLVAGTSTFSGVALFDIGSGLSLTLDSQLAGDLSAAFGVPDLTGAAIGTASVNASTATTPEPATLGLAGLSLLAFAFAARRQFAHSKV